MLSVIIFHENPWCDFICIYDEFGGDDRTNFSFWATSFRTRSDIYVTIDNQANQYFTHNKQTGITYGYSNGVLAGQDQADADADMDAIHHSAISFGYFDYSLSSPNPMTPSPTIDADYSAQI